MNDPFPPPVPRYSQNGYPPWVDDLFAFRLMLTPILVRILFAFGCIVAVLFGLSGLVNPGIGLLTIPTAWFALIGWRVACEATIVLFSIHEELRKR